MPMNRHMTWGDRQAEDARERNLKKLQKLAAKAGAPTAQITSTVDAPEVSLRADSEAKPAPAAPKAARPKSKPAAKAPTKKTASAKSAKRGKK